MGFYSENNFSGEIDSVRLFRWSNFVSFGDWGGDFASKGGLFGEMEA